MADKLEYLQFVVGVVYFVVQLELPPCLFLVLWEVMWLKYFW